MTDRVVTSFCRICSGCCGVQMTVDDDGRVVDVRGDKQQPMTQGYVCFKGLQVEETHHSPARLLSPLKRQPDGSFVAIPLERALDEVADKMNRIMERGGSDAMGLFAGNGGILNSTMHTMLRSFMAAIGSKQLFTTFSIDQSAKLVAFERMGGWAAGKPDLNQSDVALLFAANPLVSHAAIGYLVVDPSKRLRRAKARGLKLIVVDPRCTETARHADLFVQPFPGQDAAIAAGLLHIILSEGWHDKNFCERYVSEEGVASLRAAISSFTPEVVAARCGITASELFDVAAMFARDNKRGHACSATGTNMAPYSNVAQHMIDCLNVVCGRFRRPGDRVPVDMSQPPTPVVAEVIPPPRSWKHVAPSRIRGVGTLLGERMTGTLAEEILSPGKGQIKGLIVDGANIANSVPDQHRMVDALHSLDLLVLIEPYMTSTARLAHYIFPPKMQYERADLPLSFPGFPIIPESWMQYAAPVLDVPKDSSVIDDWYFFWSIAKRLNLKIIYDGKTPLDMEVAPTTEDLIAIRLAGSQTSLEELKQFPSGKIFGVVSSVAAGTDSSARFDVMPDDVAEELNQFRKLDPAISGRRRKFLLSSRRMRDMFCSIGTHLDTFRLRTPTNPAFLNPADLTILGLQSGDLVQLKSDAGQIIAVVKADETMKQGVVSIAHGWGGLPDDVAETGSCVNRLVDCTTQFETINAMPWISAIPVDIVPIGQS